MRSIDEFSILSRCRIISWKRSFELFQGKDIHNNDGAMAREFEALCHIRGRVQTVDHCWRFETVLWKPKKWWQIRVCAASIYCQKWCCMSCFQWFCWLVNIEKLNNIIKKQLGIGSISTVVASILAKGAWKLGEDLKVVACQPARPPPLIGPGVEVDPYWLRFTEINLPSLSHKEFKEFVAAAAKSTVEQVTFEKESGQALVKFNEKPSNLHLFFSLKSVSSLCKINWNPNRLQARFGNIVLLSFLWHHDFGGESAHYWFHFSHFKGQYFTRIAETFLWESQERWGKDQGYKTLFRQHLCHPVRRPQRLTRTCSTSRTFLDWNKFLLFECSCGQSCQEATKVGWSKSDSEASQGKHLFLTEKDLNYMNILWTITLIEEILYNELILWPTICYYFLLCS